MPIVKPFKAVRYNKELVPDISTVVAPPYDVIPKDMQEELYRHDQYNVVRLILNKINPEDDSDDNRYSRSRGFFNSWLESNVLTRDRSDALYIYSQKYKRGKKDVEQVGFVGLMGIDLGKKDKVLPHENTLAAPKEDRLNLMRAVKANLSPIFVLYDDSKITKVLKSFSGRNKTIADVVWEGNRHRLWRVDDPKIIKMVQSRMKSKDIFIADGHHRYETAKNYLKEVRASHLPEEAKEASGYIMVYFVESDEDMLTVLSTHRLIKELGNLKKDEIIGKVSKFFRVEKSVNMDKMMRSLEALSGEHAFGMYLGNGEFYTLTIKDVKASDKVIKHKSKEWKRLDVSMLHHFIIQRILGIRDADDNIEFSKDPAKVIESVDSGEAAVGFLLNPTKVAQVKKIAKLGERMPRKSTYFYPKPLSGLVINKL